MKPTVVCMIALAALTNPNKAQGDSSFSYQGQLKLAGAPVTAPADFEFSLWDAELGGSQVGTVVFWNAVGVENGLFQVSLDFGANALNGPRWLAISVRSPAGGGAFTPVLPRQPITASPYSIQTRGIFVNDTGLVGIGTSAPLDQLHVRGDQPTLRLEDDDDPLSFTEVKDAQPTQLRINKTNSAGLVLLDLNPKPTDGSSAGVVRLFRETDTAGAKGLQLLRGNNSTETSASIGVDGADSWFQAHGGSLGVGITAPEASLHVRGSVMSDGSAGGTFVARNPNNPDAAVSLSWLNDVARLRIAGDGPGAAGGLDIQKTGDRSLLRITHSGAVGIGTTAPQARLDVAGDGNFHNRLGIGNPSSLFGQLTIADSGDGSIFAISADSDNAAFPTIFANNANGPVLWAQGTSDAEPSGGGLIVAGDQAGTNIAIDNNEIMARNGGTTSTLFLNNDGGDVVIGGALDLDIQLVKNTVNDQSGVDVSCPTGMKVLGGGCYIDLHISSPALRKSQPFLDLSGWSCAHDYNLDNADEFTAYAICAKVK